MAHDEESQSKFTRRALIFGGFGAMGFAGIASRLYQLQVLESGKYQGLSEDNQFNYRLLVPSRGRILDKNGQALAINTQNYRLLLILEHVTDLDALLHRLSQLVPLSAKREAEIRKEYARHDPLAPIRIVDNMDWKSFAKVNLWLPELGGVRPDVGEVREYPNGSDFAHVLGYVGRVPPGQAKDAEPLLRHPGFRIGRTAIEKHYDPALRGSAGALKIEVNALGHVVRELPDVRTKAVAGDDLSLTLDLNLQRVAMQALAGTSAAACVLDLHGGEVRALASTPSYDPNKFARGISQKEYTALLDDPLKPLFFKATGGTYSPASTFKPVVAMAAFDAGVIDPGEHIRCTGKIKLGNREFHCWHRRGHGRVNLHTAIGTSCDIYFYELARRLGIERIHDAAIQFGFGQEFNLGLGTENAGLVPNAAWKRARFDAPWAQGETLIAGIGQGYLAANPLQMAVMSARIATGRAIMPTIMKTAQAKESSSDFSYSKRAFSIARRGMGAVVNEPWGTGYRVGGLDGKQMAWAGKTGTGQVRRISKKERETRVKKNSELPWKLRDHALFVGYAPFDNPRFAISVVVEHGGGGSAVAAPKAREILKFALAQETKGTEKPQTIQNGGIK